MIWTKQPIKTSIEKINDKIVGDYFSVSSLSDLETRLSSIGSSMANHSQRPVSFYFNGVSAPFTTDTYVGIMTRTYADRYQIKLNQNAWNNVITGSKNSSGWLWDSLALQSSVDTLNSKFAIEPKESDNILISAGDRAQVSIPISKEGYTPVGIIAVYTTQTQVMSITSFYISGSNAIVGLYNNYSEPRDGKMIARILYSKT